MLEVLIDKNMANAFLGLLILILIGLSVSIIDSLGWFKTGWFKIENFRLKWFKNGIF